MKPTIIKRYCCLMAREILKPKALASGSLDVRSSEPDSLLASNEISTVHKTCTNRLTRRLCQGSQFVAYALRVVQATVMLMALMLLLQASKNAWALNAAGQSPTYDAGADALRQGTNPVWADVREEQVTLGRSLPVHQDLSDRHINTVDQPVTSSGNTNTGGGTGTWSGFSGGDWLVFFLRAFLVLLVVGLLIFLIALMSNGQLARRRRRGKVRGGDGEDLAAQRAKLTDLPFEMESTLVGFKAQAERLRQEKQYAQATVYLFSYLLVECDAANCIRLAKGKTNHRYIRELKAWPKLQRPFQELVEMFEAAFFGGKEISESRFEAFWSKLPQVEAIVEERRGASDVGVGTIAGIMIWGLLGLSCAGCKQPINSVYGESDSYVGECSPSGLTVFRELAQERGFRTQRMESLSPAMHTSVQTIVWMPDRFPMHKVEVMRALQEWLRTGNKTLIYVGRDASPQSEYWKEVVNGTGAGSGSGVNGLQRLRAMQEGANEALALDLRRDEARDLMVTPWFYARKAFGPVRKIEQFSGPWADAFEGQESQVVARMTLLPYVDEASNNERRDGSENGNAAMGEDGVRGENGVTSEKGVPTVDVSEQTSDSVSDQVTRSDVDSELRSDRVNAELSAEGNTRGNTAGNVAGNVAGNNEGITGGSSAENAAGQQVGEQAGQQAGEEGGAEYRQQLSQGVRRVEELRQELDWEKDGRVFTGGIGIFRGGIVPQILPPGQEYAREFTEVDRQQLEIITNVHVGDYDRVKRWLVGGGGEGLVWELPYAVSDGRVILVANGSLVSNVGMLRRSHREIASRILGRCSPGVVGFLGGENDPLVRESGEMGGGSKGFEVLTLWPMNIFTIHLAIAAMVAMLALYPVFGRPRGGKSGENSDFGEHVQAVGELLRGTRDAGYAKRTIAKYFRVVRGDTVSGWSSLDRSDTDQ